MAMPSSVLAASRGIRVEVKPVVYVNWAEEQAFLLNVSESGMAVQAMEVLTPGHSLPFAFSLPESGNEVRGVARIVWADCSGRAGLQFLDVPEYDRYRLRQWIIQNQN
jgi:hypothetical protein